MSLGFLFLKRTDHQGWFRNIVIVFAITLATGILLSSMAFANVFLAQNNRQLKRSENIFSHSDDIKLPLEKNGDRLLVRGRTHYFDDQPIIEIGVHPITDQSKWYLMKALPKDKEIYVSPGLKRLIEQNPQIHSRYTGWQIKTDFPEELLLTPNEKIAIHALQPAALNFSTSRGEFGLIDGKVKPTGYQNTQTARQAIFNTFMAICSLGVSFPLLILIISATRVGMVQREQRYAALSLIGTPKRQINRIILAETLAWTSLGLIFGALFFLSLKHFVLARISIGGDTVFIKDITVPPHIFCCVILLIFLVTILVNAKALHKVKTSPLGIVKRRKKLRRPTLFRLVPLIFAGLSIWRMNQLGPKWFFPDTGYSPMPIYAILGAFLLLMIGLLVAGPYLTYLVAKIIERFSHRATSLIATKRLQLFAKPIFSSVSGVVLAVFVSSFLLTIAASVKITAQKFYQIEENTSASSNGLYALRLNGHTKKLGELANLIDQHQEFSTLVKSRHLVKLFLEKASQEADHTPERTRLTYGRVYTCTNVRDFTRQSCPSNLSPTTKVVVEPLADGKARLVELTTELLSRGTLNDDSLAFSFQNASDHHKAKLLLQNILASSYRTSGDDYLLESVDDNTINPLTKIQGFINAIMAATAITILMAGFSVAVSMVGAFFERKKSFADLRLMGTDLHQLYRVVLLESILPLFLATSFAAFVGIFAAKYLSSATSQNFIFALPDHGYLPMIIGFTFASVGIICLTLPLLRRITSHEANRTE